MSIYGSTMFVKLKFKLRFQLIKFLNESRHMNDYLRMKGGIVFRSTEKWSLVWFGKEVVYKWTLNDVKQLPEINKT